MTNTDLEQIKKILDTSLLKQKKDIKQELIQNLTQSLTSSLSKIMDEKIDKATVLITGVIDNKIDLATGLVMETTNDKFSSVSESMRTTNEILDRFQKDTRERFDMVDDKLIRVESEVVYIKQALVVKKILDEPDIED